MDRLSTLLKRFRPLNLFPANYAENLFLDSYQTSELFFDPTINYKIDHFLHCKYLPLPTEEEYGELGPTGKLSTHLSNYVQVKCNYCVDCRESFDSDEATRRHFDYHHTTRICPACEHISIVQQHEHEIMCDSCLLCLKNPHIRLTSCLENTCKVIIANHVRSYLDIRKLPIPAKFFPELELLFKKTLFRPTSKSFSALAPATRRLITTRRNLYNGCFPYHYDYVGIGDCEYNNLFG